MKLLIITLGKPKHKDVASATREYMARVARYAPAEWVTLPTEDIAPRASAADVATALGREASRILEKLPANAALVTLDREGQALDSVQLSQHLDRWMQTERHVALVIGSAWGLDPALAARAKLRLSLSRLTLAHELAALVLTEQLYRAFSILRGEPYHK